MNTIELIGNNPYLSNEDVQSLKEDMRRWGYLLPTNDEELEEFEKIYGSTRVIMPEDLNDQDFLFKDRSSRKTIQLSGDGENISPKTGKQIVQPLPNSYFRKLVLAAEIASQLHVEPTFGHVKFVKLLYLCEHICDMQLGTNYKKHAAGPLDPKLIRSIDAGFMKQGWFIVSKKEYGYRYEPTEKSQLYRKYFERYFSEDLEKIDQIINLFRKKATDFCEIVATLFAVWLESGKPNIGEEQLFQGFYTWNKSKSKYKPQELKSGLTWMGEHGIIPVF